MCLASRWSPYPEKKKYIWKSKKGIGQFHHFLKSQSMTKDYRLQLSISSSWSEPSFHPRSGHLTGLRSQNRYLIPLSFVVGLWAYFRDTWSPQVSHLRQFFSREDNLKLN